ncbi:hypothetical protein [uncultured Desulfuromusa sp.]|uniref:hypothetical protein n=1 Tax=uncultured Desulfuromusa sp. TaxID=219183 RepID=UPI002AA64BFE|nr:hypothetical protein [uncultured Desulfuromusa sp.]
MKQDKRAEIHELFKGAIDNSNEQQRKDRFKKIFSNCLYWLLIFSLIATTLPHPTVNIISSFTVVFLAGSIAFISFRLLLQKTVIAFLLLSLVSGCSAATFTKSNFDMLDLNLCGSDEPCRMGSASGIAVLGLGLDDVSVEVAQMNGLITKVRGVDSARSYGLISMASVRVVGD